MAQEERLFGLSVGMPAPNIRHGIVLSMIQNNIFLELWENDEIEDYHVIQGHSLSDDNPNDFQPDVMVIDAESGERVLIFEVEHGEGFFTKRGAVKEVYLKKGVAYIDAGAEYYLYLYDKNLWFGFEDGAYVPVPPDTEPAFLEMSLAELVQAPK